MHQRRRSSDRPLGALVGVARLTLVNRPSPGPVVEVGRQRAHEQNPRNEPVKDQRHTEGGDVEQREVQEVDGHVEGPGDAVPTRDHHPVGVGGLVRVHQEEPHDAVERGEDPDSRDDPFGPRHGADELRLDGVADGDVALHGEGHDGAGRHVDAQILEHHQDHHDVPRDSDSANEQRQKNRHNLLLQRLQRHSGPVRLLSGVVEDGGVVLHAASRLGQKYMSEERRKYFTWRQTVGLKIYDSPRRDEQLSLDRLSTSQDVLTLTAPVRLGGKSPARYRASLTGTIDRTSSHSRVWTV